MLEAPVLVTIRPIHPQLYTAVHSRLREPIHLPHSCVTAPIPYSRHITSESTGESETVGWRLVATFVAWRLSASFVEAFCWMEALNISLTEAG